MDQGLWTKRLKRFLWFLLVTGLWSTVHGPRSMVSSSLWASPPITGIQLTGQFSTSKERILDILPFKVGDTFDAEKLDEGIGYLKKWGIFDKVESHTNSDSKGVIINIDLHEANIISEIDITGNYPYVKTKIRKRLNLQVGDMLIPEKLEEQKERIISFYDKRGFYNTRVDIEKEEANAANKFNVTFHVHKGERLRIKEVQIEGVPNYFKGRISSFIATGDLYSEKRLREALQRLVQFYRNRGYFKTRVKLTDKNIDWKTRRVSLKLSVAQGPKVKVFFKGRSHYRLKTLKRVSLLFEEGDFDPVALQMASNKLVEHFQKDGFKDAQISAELKKISPDLFHVIFHVQPGPRSHIRLISFSGNRSIPGKKLKKQLLSKEYSITQRGVLDTALLGEDQKIALEFYESKGFPDVSIAPPETSLSPDRIRFNVRFNIEEGALVKVEELAFEGNRAFSKKELTRVLQNKEKGPFNKVSLVQDKEQLQLFYANRGYPYAQVEQKIERSENKITITHTIHEGPFVKIGEILIIGDVLTGVRAIRQALGLKTGSPYSYQKIVEAQLSLRRLGAFNAVSVEPIGLEEKQTTIPLRIKVEERQPFVIDLDGQYSTDQNFAATLKFTNFNSFGWAKQTGLLFTAGREKDRTEISWFDPRFLGYDIQTSFSSWIDYNKKPIETSLQTGGAVSFFRQFHRFGFLTRYELARTYNLAGRATDPTALRDSTLSQVSLSGSFDTRNSFADPGRGFFTLLGTNIFNEIEGTRANFAKLKWVFSHYYSPFRRFTFSNSVRFDRIQDIEEKASVPARQLYTLGGDDTLRGFGEDNLGPQDSQGKAVGGRIRLITSSELHIRFVSALQGALFLEMGSLTNSLDDINSSALRKSAGFGLRYITPVGPIRADYGIILDRKTNESFGRFHLTFGYPF